MVVRADILEGPDGRSKGCGIIEFADARDATRAVNTLNDTELNGHYLPTYLSIYLSYLSIY